MSEPVTIDVLHRELAELRRRVNRLEAADKGATSVLTMAEVIVCTTLSRREIGRRVKTGGFPKPVKLGAKRVGWRKAAIQKWLREREEREQQAS